MEKCDIISLNLFLWRINWLDLNKCVQNIEFDELADVERTFGLPKTITPEMYRSFKAYIYALKQAV